MKSIGKLLMVLGASVGVMVGVAMLAHIGVAGPWLINVALAKLGLAASAGLMAAGAVGIRIANRREQARLPSGTDRSVG